MHYLVREDERANNKFKDEKGSIWLYIDKKTYENEYKDNSKVYADLRKIDSESRERTLKGSVSRIGLYEYKRIKKLETVVGYIPVTIDIDSDNKQDGFVRIVKRSSVAMSIILALLLIVIIGIFLGGFYLANKEDIPGLDKAAVSYNASNLVNKDPSKILLPGIEKIVMEEGSHVKKVLPNPQGNPCLFKYRFVLLETNEVIYESGFLQPGKAVMEFDLNRVLNEGSYPVEIRIETRDLKDVDKTLNAGVLSITLEVVKE